jgi:trehalose-6-phosphate synthase
VLLNIRQLGVCLANPSFSTAALKLDQLAEQCATLIVYQLENDYVASVQKTRGFQMDYGDEKDEYKGKTASMMMASIEDEEMPDEKKLQEQKM